MATSQATVTRPALIRLGKSFGSSSKFSFKTASRSALSLAMTANCSIDVTPMWKNLACVTSSTCFLSKRNTRSAPPAFIAASFSNAVIKIAMLAAEGGWGRELGAGGGEAT